MRLFGKGLGDQAGWTVPLALFGLIATIRLLLLDRRRRRRADGGPGGPGSGAEADTQEHILVAPLADPGAASVGAPAGAGGGDADGEEALGRSTPWRKDPRVATTVVLGGWFVVEATVLSLSKGIVHPYYVSALAPATGAMAGIGAIAMVKLRREGSPGWAIVLAALTVIGTIVVQVILLYRESYLLWLVPVLVAGGALGLLAFAFSRQLAAPALASTFLLLLLAPAAYSHTTWAFPVEGTFAAAGPKATAGKEDYGVGSSAMKVNYALSDYLRTHHPGKRWDVFTVAADTAAPMILTGTDAAPLGGYSGTDPALDGPGLARLVASGDVRYVLLGGAYSTRGGNEATKAVLRSCRLVGPEVWNDPDHYLYSDGVTLFDCAGRARRLALDG